MLQKELVEQLSMEGRNQRKILQIAPAKVSPPRTLQAIVATSDNYNN